jgi:D-3-phosphoglycerate dehydrogenase
MRKCTKLKIIAKHGAGLDNICLPEAKELGISVTNVPAMNANAVADLAFGHILNISRGISIAEARVKKGEWKTYTGRDVYNKNLGLVGFGAIAQNVARRAKGFSMKIFVYDPFLKEIPNEFKGYVNIVKFDKLISISDFISLHLPLTDETKDMFNKETLLSMKKEAFLINTARGGIINEKDLYECMKNGHLAGVALDVTEKEPINMDNPLLMLENVVVTPHMGMYSIEAINAVSIVCAKNVVKKLEGKDPEYVVV